jgi:hypothetical protein
LHLTKAESFRDGSDGVISQPYEPITISATPLADIGFHLLDDVFFVTHCSMRLWLFLDEPPTSHLSHQAAINTTHLLFIVKGD